MKARFILSKKKVIEQYNQLKSLGLHVSYSYKTNREIGNVLQNLTDCDFSVHNLEETEMIKNKKKIWFFSQAWNNGEINKILKNGVRNFIVDNEIDLNLLLNVIEERNIKINLGFRMKFREHRIGSGRYFVYGLSARRVCDVLGRLKNNPFINKIGIHLHRKSQNTSEWDVVNELKDSFGKEYLDLINFVNIGGGLPIKYKTYSANILPYIFDKIKEVRDFLAKHKIEIFIEPGRFIAGPPIRLETEIIRVDENVIVLNCSIYNSAIDTVITNIRLLVEGELREHSEEGDFYLIKGNTPTRDDMFRYKVRLNKPKIGDRIIFLNAGAYNWFSDFCNLKKLETVIVEDFE